jgi:hypothetical protein
LPIIKVIGNKQEEIMRTHFSLRQFCEYLKDNYPIAAISYPVALRLVKANKIKAIKIGSQHRITITEALRFATDGNFSGEEQEQGTVTFDDDFTIPKKLNIDLNIDPEDPIT